MKAKAQNSHLHYQKQNDMSDINTVIVEDDENSLSILQLLIKNHCQELRLVGIARDVESAVNVINDQKPDLLFLDIDLPDGSGFDILKQINHFYYEVTFTTVHNKYAANGDLSVLTRAASLMKKAESSGNKIQNMGQVELGSSCWDRYLRIHEKLTEAAMNMTKNLPNNYKNMQNQLENLDMEDIFPN
jgi:DNA-binding LytR/AlgR family response regulator